MFGISFKTAEDHRRLAEYDAIEHAVCSAALYTESLPKSVTNLITGRRKLSADLGRKSLECEEWHRVEAALKAELATIRAKLTVAQHRLDQIIEAETPSCAHIGKRMARIARGEANGSAGA